jgi:hypothetical protein
VLTRPHEARMVALRDAAVQLVLGCGRFEPLDVLHELGIAHTGRVTAALAIPIAYATQSRRSVQPECLPWRVGTWTPVHVLDVEWHRECGAQVLDYRRGDWEAELFSFAAALTKERLRIAH